MPCPFCGGNELDTPESGEVFCRSCKALGPDAPRGKAIEAWNRRAPISTEELRRATFADPQPFPGFIPRHERAQQHLRRENRAEWWTYSWLPPCNTCGCGCGVIYGRPRPHSRNRFNAWLEWVKMRPEDFDGWRPSTLATTVIVSPR